MRIAIGADQGGFKLKNIMVPFLTELGHDVTDVGTDSETSVDYPDYARAVSREVLSHKAGRGILICGKGYCEDMAFCCFLRCGAPRPKIGESRRNRTGIYEK